MNWLRVNTTIELVMVVRTIIMIDLMNKEMYLLFLY